MVEEERGKIGGGMEIVVATESAIYNAEKYIHENQFSSPPNTVCALYNDILPDACCADTIE